MPLIYGCANTGVFETDNDTYAIAIRSGQIGFGPPNAAIAEAYKEARTFCGSRGTGVETVSTDVVDSGFARPGSVMLKFKCKGNS
jgi:hypothetical protein